MTDAEAAVLKFVRGIDLSKYNGDNLIQTKMQRLSNLRWLKLNCLNLHNFPQISEINSLESLSVVNNQIKSLIVEENPLETLTNINLRKNNLGDDSSPMDFRTFIETVTLDLSYNKISFIPKNIEMMINLVALNLSHNQIAELPEKIFLNWNKLIFLDLSHNKIDSIPSSLKSCGMLQIINFRRNPIGDKIHCDLSSLSQLKSINLSATGLSDEFSFQNFLTLESLSDLDMSENNITKFPEAILKISSLTRLNLSSNKIAEIPEKINLLSKLKVLNISFNQIEALPDSISKLTDLRRLYINGNELKSGGIPQSINQLINLEIFMAAFNKLDTIPPSLCRCINLKKLILRNNNLLTLPDLIYNIKTLQTLDVKGNPDLVMPKKPCISGDVYSRMDFSYDNIRNMVFALLKQQLPPPEVTKGEVHKEKLQVHKKTKIEKLEEIQKAEAQKFTKKLEIATQENTVTQQKKKLRETIRSNIDCSEIFPEGVGNLLGVTIFHIENFLPLFSENEFGVFYDGDCYIVLNAVHGDSGIDRRVYFWIGDASSIDKKACSAMHAVNLRNLLQIDDRTYREEQGTESEEFKNLFPSGITYLHGMATACSFYSIENDPESQPEMYRLTTNPHTKSILAQKTGLSSAYIDPRFVFTLITKDKIFLYFGSKVNLNTKNKSRLLAEKIKKAEYKGKSDIIHVDENDEESATFWKYLGGKPDEVVENGVYDDNFSPQPVVYKLIVGPGYLELPQVPYSNDQLLRSSLQSDTVYILDFWTEIYVWAGRSTNKIAKEAARRLAFQIQKFFNRPFQVDIKMMKEDEETVIFKSKFHDWNDILGVDYTLSAESVTSKREKVKTLADDGKPKLLTHEDFNLPKMEISCIFLPRQPPLSDSECRELIETAQEDLEKMDSFVFEDKAFTKMDESEIGHFYSHNCYVFLCRNIVFVDEPESTKEVEKRYSTSMEDEEGEEYQKTDVRYNVYFWEGKKCPRTGFLNFAFSLQKMFEDLFGDKLVIERIRQQQEPPNFLALFDGKFVIHRGKRPSKTNLRLDPTINLRPRMYQIRCMMGIITRRCVEIDLNSFYLSSYLCYLVSVPKSFDEDSKEIVGDLYLWIGKNCPQAEVETAEKVGNFYVSSRPSQILSIIKEEEEPEEFWSLLGGKKPYDTSGLYLTLSRLFRCSNESGFFGFKEKSADFCHEDLVDDDVMLLDTGETIYLWIGLNPSSAEKTLTRKLAPVYAESCRVMKFGTERKIVEIRSGNEPDDFKRVFQGFEI